MPSRRDPLIAVALLIAIAAVAQAQPQNDVQPPPAENSRQPSAEDLPATGDLSAADEAPIVGRLSITTDAAATIRIGSEELGLVMPGESRLVEVREFAGLVVATSAETPGATVREAYAFEEPTPSAEKASAAPNIHIRIRLLKAIRQVKKTQRKEGIFTDFKHSLMWRRKDNSSDVTWKSARNHCHELEFAGFEDWRLPQIEELDTLQAIWSRAAFKTLDPITPSACCPWSATEIDDRSAWHYDFRFRKAFEGRKSYSFGFRALCTRTLTADEVREHELDLLERKKKKKPKKAGSGKPEDADSPPSDPLDDGSRRR